MEAGIHHRGTTLKPILMTLLYGLVFSTYAFGNPNEKVRTNLDFHAVNSLQICATDTKDCIQEFNIFDDLYSNQKQVINYFDNFALIKNQSIVHIKNSVRFSDRTDLYAIFLVQKNEFRDKEGYGSCHACAPKLGIAIYQYHNKWKLFSVDNDVMQFGSYGTFNITSKDIKIIPRSPEHFLITLESSDGGQGFVGSTTTILEVNSGSFLSKLSTRNTVDIKVRGFIQSGASSCGAKSDGESWTGDLTFDTNSKSQFPLVKMKKTFYRCDSKTPQTTANVEFKYDPVSKSFKEEYQPPDFQSLQTRSLPPPASPHSTLNAKP